MTTIQSESKPKRNRTDFSKTPPLAMSIAEFCKAHRISTAFFYLLDEQGKAPRTMRVGARRLVSIEEARRWREAQTEDA